MVTKIKETDRNLVQFLRQRDYKILKQLGQGACGRTVLLHDDVIDEDFVCKKYAPFSETNRQQLFANFVREIKLLHKVSHKNVVRVFNYYVYPDKFAGFILMEFIEGSDIDEYLAVSPEKINEVFIQALDGFSYLEANNILHRDIRPQNLLVRSDGILKIIDLGFGKRIEDSKDFDKSISLNWWCEPPLEFGDGIYDFCSEVYFVGKLFANIIQQSGIEYFDHLEILRSMCQRDPKLRIKSFADIDREIRSNRFSEIGFTPDERNSYRHFADLMENHVTKIQNGAKYRSDVDRLEVELDDIYRNVMLEEMAPDAGVITRLFIFGPYYYKKKGFPVRALRDFLELLKTSGIERKRVILANLHTRLDAIPRYSPNEPGDDEIPF